MRNSPVSSERDGMDEQDHMRFLEKLQDLLFFLSAFSLPHYTLHSVWRLARRESVTPIAPSLLLGQTRHRRRGRDAFGASFSGHALEEPLHRTVPTCSAINLLSTPLRVAQPSRARTLKLSLPGVDSSTVTTLTAEDLAHFPSPPLCIQSKCGQLEDYRDFQIINVQDDRHDFTIMALAAWLTKGRLEHGGLQVERLGKPGLPSTNDPVPYAQDLHAHDVAFVATKDTHACFLQRIGMYMFSIRAGMRDFQEYLSSTTCYCTSGQRSRSLGRAFEAAKSSRKAGSQ